MSGKGQATSQMPCPQCQQMMAVRFPLLRIINYPEISMILFNHPNLEKCPQCGSAYAVKINGFNQNGGLEFALAGVRTEQSAIVAPSAEETVQINKEKLPS